MMNICHGAIQSKLKTMDKTMKDYYFHKIPKIGNAKVFVVLDDEFLTSFGSAKSAKKYRKIHGLRGKILSASASHIEFFRSMHRLFKNERI